MLARRTEEEAEEDEDLEFELVVDPPPTHPHVVAQGSTRIASGTTPPRDTRPPPEAVPELRARTLTVHDPLTTSVLAEVARRHGSDRTSSVAIAGNRASAVSAISRAACRAPCR